MKYLNQVKYQQNKKQKRTKLKILKAPKEDNNSGVKERAPLLKIQY